MKLARTVRFADRWANRILEKNPTTIETQTIAALARENHRLKIRVEDLEDTDQRRRSWLDKAKREAGFSSYVSFDDVWAKALKAYLETKEGKEQCQSTSIR